MLADELRHLGASNVRVSEHCVVYASVPSNMPNGAPPVTAIGFLAHVDTSPAVSGANVRPVIHRDYRGGDIQLPGDPSQVITVAQNPLLEGLIGDDIISTDGTTLLGSDDKAGVAAIMTLVDLVMKNPDVRHGPISIGFTPDEEIGSGIDKFDVAAFGAEFAYTVDGGELGEINDETWSARLATVSFRGKSTHPGTAKGVMVNSIHALADFVTRLPGDMLPETTEDRVGFVHPYIGSADVETSTIKVLLRDFELPGLDDKERLLRDIATKTESTHPGRHDHDRRERELQEHERGLEGPSRAGRECVRGGPARRRRRPSSSRFAAARTDRSSRSAVCPARTSTRAATTFTRKRSSTRGAVSRRPPRHCSISCRSLRKRAAADRHGH